MDETTVPSQEVLYDLNCLIERESIIFPVAVTRDSRVGYLKKAIQRERALSTLKGVDPHTLELWKVSASQCEGTS